jgi:SagB-type dehydrogenase family enzyme
MKKLSLLFTILVAAILVCSCEPQSIGNSTENLEGKLPAPKIKGKVTVEETMNLRKSVRQFQDVPLSIEHVSQLLWAAQGITHSWGDRQFRTAPSAGATYPLETYLFTASGVYKYNVQEHSLVRIFENDLRTELSEVSLGQTSLSQSHAVFLFTGIEERTAQRYGERAYRYMCMEAGHVAQNIHLQAVALGLGSVPVGAFDDAKVTELLKLAENEVPLYMVPVGYSLEEE